MRQFVLAVVEIGVGPAEVGDFLGQLVELLGQCLELDTEQLPSLPQHRGGLRPPANLIQHQFRDDRRTQLPPQPLERLPHLLRLRPEPTHGGLAGASDAALLLEGDGLLERKQPVPQLADLRIPGEGRVHHLVRKGLFGIDLPGLTRLRHLQFGVDGGDVTVGGVEVLPHRGEVLHQQAALRGHLLAVAGAERFGETVDGVATGAKFGLVLLELLLHRVAP